MNVTRPLIVTAILYGSETWERLIQRNAVVAAIAAMVKEKKFETRENWPMVNSGMDREWLRFGVLSLVLCLRHGFGGRIRYLATNPFFSGEVNTIN